MKSRTKRLLIVEDSELILERLFLMLKDVEGLEIVGTAKTRQEAIQRIDSDLPDLVLLDIALSDGDGFQILEQIQAGRNAPQVVILTNFGNPLFRQRAKRLGVMHFYDKSTQFESAIDALTALARSEG
jgi:DNA-binding NarL/FixJ family response regulator